MGAGVIHINSVHYNRTAHDGGHEWIEVVNTGDDPVLLSSLRVMIGDRGHKIVPVSDVADLAPDEHAAIVQNEALFRAHNPAFNGAVFHSSFTIPNGGTIISLVDSRGAVIAQFNTNRTITKHTKHIHHRGTHVSCSEGLCSATARSLSDFSAEKSRTRRTGHVGVRGGGGTQTVLGTDTLPTAAFRPAPLTNTSTSVWLLAALVLAAAAVAVWWYSDPHADQ